MSLRTIALLAAGLSWGFGAGLSHARDGWEGGKDVAVCAEEHDQQHPSVSLSKQGLIVVWQDSRPDGKKEGTKFPFSVRGKYWKYHKEFVVLCPPDANAMDPEISGNRVVFVHNRGWSNVMMLELPRGTAKLVGDVAFAPAIDGNVIAFESAKHRWERWTGKGAPPLSWISDISGYEAVGIELPFDVTNSEALNQRSPAVSGTTIVWEETNKVGGWREHGIYKRDINTDPDPVRISKRPGTSARNPAVSGGIVVWQDNRNGNWDIYGYDLGEGREFEICREEGDQEAPAVDGETVVWQDHRGGDWDIRGFGLEAKQSFVVHGGEGNQTEPDVCGDAVVWTDDRNGNKDITMKRRARQ